MLADKLRSRLALAVCGLALLVVGAPAASASTGGGANNVVTSYATTDGSTVVHSGLQTALLGSNAVATSNIADAESSSCTGCHAVAVAVQAVFLTADAVSTFEPANVAKAVNANCLDCESFAFAYQYVVQTSDPVRLTREGRREIQRYRDRFAALAASGEPFLQLDADLKALGDEFRAAIDDQLVAAGNPGTGTVHEQVQMAQ